MIHKEETFYEEKEHAAQFLKKILELINNYEQSWQVPPGVTSDNFSFIKPPSRYRIPADVVKIMCCCYQSNSPDYLALAHNVCDILTNSTLEDIQLLADMKAIKKSFYPSLDDKASMSFSFI